MPSNFRSYSGRHRLRLFFYIYICLFPCHVWVTFRVCHAEFFFFFTASGPFESIYQKLKHLIIFNLFITVLPHFIQNLYPRSVYPGIAQYWAPTHMPHPHYALLSEETQMGSCDPAGCTPAKSISELFLRNSFGTQWELEELVLQRTRCLNWISLK